MLFRFDEIREATGGTFLNPPRGEGVDSITTDSRLAEPNSLFLAIAGEQFDGHDFLDAALKQGARLLCVERSRLSKLPPGAPAIVVDSTIRAYQNLGTPEPFYTLHVTMGFLPLDQLRARAKSYGASITEYLSAVLIQVLLEKQAREKPRRPRPVALAIPINLRGWFPSETLRNFITTVRPCIDPNLGEYTFPEIVAQVRYFMKLHINRQEMRAEFTTKVRFADNRLLQLVPVVLKNPVVALNYKLLGIRPYTATFTNPGAFEVPAEMRPHIRHMEVILGQATVPRADCAAISYGNIMEITFAGTQKETETERDFFRFLVREGIPVKIESDRP